MLARLRELVGPRQDDGECERRAGSGLHGPRVSLELPAARGCCSPFSSAGQPADQDELAQARDLHRPVAGRLGVCDGSPRVLGDCRQVSAEEQEGTRESLLAAGPEPEVAGGIGTGFAVQLDGPATVSLVLLEVSQPAEYLRAPTPWGSGRPSLVQQLPGSLRLARLPGKVRGVHGSAMPALVRRGRRQLAGKLR